MRKDDRTSTPEGDETAGLALSVGRAGAAVRTFLGGIVLLTAGIVLGAAWALSAQPGGAVVAALLLVPLGAAGLLASAFIVAPHSRYGVGLDRVVPRLRRAPVAILVLGGLWALGGAMLLLRVLF